MAIEQAPDNLGPLQWVITTIVGIFLTVYGFLFKASLAEREELRNEIGALKVKQESSAKEVAAQAGKGDDSLWAALQDIRNRIDNLVNKSDFHRLQTILEEDRKLTVADRANIAVLMATRDEMGQQLDRHFTRLIAAWNERESAALSRRGTTGRG